MLLLPESSCVSISLSFQIAHISIKAVCRGSGSFKIATFSRLSGMKKKLWIQFVKLNVTGNIVSYQDDHERLR